VTATAESVDFYFQEFGCGGRNLLWSNPKQTDSRRRAYFPKADFLAELS